MDRSDRDHVLMRSLAQGDRDAFWELWANHQGHIRHLCQRWLRDRGDDAEDALSETMLKAWDGLQGSAADIGNLRAWLSRVAYHVCIDFWRKHNRTVSYSDVAEETGKYPVSDPSEDPEQVLLRQDACATGLGMLEGLPPHLRDPFRMHAIYDMPTREVAQKLDISLANARKRVQKARQILRDMGDAYLSGGDVPLPQAQTPTAPQAHSVVSDDEDDAAAESESNGLWSKSVDVAMVRVTLVCGAVVDQPIDLDYQPARYGARVEKLQEYVRNNVRRWRKRLELANLLYAMGRWEEAVEEYCRVLAVRRNLLDVWLRLGRTLRLMESYDEAHVAYEAALGCAQNEATRHHIVGLIELCRRRADAAAQAIARAAALEPEIPAHWHALGSAHQEAGQPCEAVSAYDRALALDGDDLVALLNSHDPLVAVGRPQEAHRRLERALQIQPNCVPALVLLAGHRCASGLVRESEGKRTRQLVQRALSLAPDSVGAWDALAHYHAARGERDRAASVLRALVERMPDSPQAWQRYGFWLFKMGQYQAAADALHRALALHPDDLATLLLACDALPLASRLATLQRVVDTMLARYSHHWNACATAGVVLATWLGDSERGVALTRRATELQPELAHTWMAHGETLSRAGLHREATSAYERGWKLLPDECCHGDAALAALSLADCLTAMGDPEAAREWHQRAAARARAHVALDAAYGHYQLGRALEALGDIPGAVKAYDTALLNHLLWPERQEVEQALERIQGSRRRTARFAAA